MTEGSPTRVQPAAASYYQGAVECLPAIKALARAERCAPRSVQPVGTVVVLLTMLDVAICRLLVKFIKQRLEWVVRGGQSILWG